MKGSKLAKLALAISFITLTAPAQSSATQPPVDRNPANKAADCKAPGPPAPPLPGVSNENKADPTSQNNPCTPDDKATSDKSDNENTSEGTTRQASPPTR